MADRGGGEMRGVVDEPDGPEGEGERAPQAQGPDWDKIFAYKTFKIVRIRDRNLGFLYWSIVLLVVLYVAIVAFNIEGKHTQRDVGFGTSITRFKGKAFVRGSGKVFDQADLRFPAIEPQGAFIWTKRVVVPEQKRGTCVDMDSPRKCGGGAAPCPAGLPCEDGHCQVHGWCPAVGDLNADDPPEGAVVERLDGLEHTMLQIVTSIAFPFIGNKMYVAGDTAEGGNRFKNITLGELISKAEPKISFEEVMEKGCLIGVSFLWSCDVTQDCEPTVAIKHLDGGNGFVQKRSRLGRKDGVETREAIYMWGVRILVDAVGVGRKTSLVLIILQVGSGLALLRTASIAADFLMLQLYSKEKKEAYYRCKVIETPDYSDLQDRLHLVQEQQKAQAERAELLGRPTGASSSSSGAQGAVPLGMGPGARGGMPSALLRGRGGGGGGGGGG